MLKPRLSVVVPNYNHARYLPRCLAAIFAQEYAPDEIVVIDYASTDNRFLLVREPQSFYNLLRLVRNDFNPGAVATINNG